MFLFTCVKHIYFSKKIKTMVYEIPTLSMDISGGAPQQTGSGSATRGVPLISGSTSTNQNASVSTSNTILVPVNHADKLERFNWRNFKRWQQKTMFYLTTLGLSRFLKEDAPKYNEESDQQTLMAIDAWKTTEYLCRNYVMNGLADSLYNVYSTAVGICNPVFDNCRTPYNKVVIGQGSNLPDRPYNKQPTTLCPPIYIQQEKTEIVDTARKLYDVCT
ncbi:hypothetical protein OROMI_001441 [Orobanche minor]